MIKKTNYIKEGIIRENSIATFNIPYRNSSKQKRSKNNNNKKRDKSSSSSYSDNYSDSLDKSKSKSSIIFNNFDINEYDNKNQKVKSVVKGYIHKGVSYIKAEKTFNKTKTKMTDLIDKENKLYCYHDCFVDNTQKQNKEYDNIKNELLSDKDYQLSCYNFYKKNRNKTNNSNISSQNNSKTSKLNRNRHRISNKYSNITNKNLLNPLLIEKHFSSKTSLFKDNNNASGNNENVINDRFINSSLNFSKSLLKFNNKKNNISNSSKSTKEYILNISNGSNKSHKSTKNIVNEVLSKYSDSYIRICNKRFSVDNFENHDRYKLKKGKSISENNNELIIINDENNNEISNMKDILSKTSEIDTAKFKDGPKRITNKHKIKKKTIDNKTNISISSLTHRKSSNFIVKSKSKKKNQLNSTNNKTNQLNKNISPAHVVKTINNNKRLNNSKISNYKNQMNNIKPNTTSNMINHIRKNEYLKKFNKFLSETKYLGVKYMGDSDNLNFVNIITASKVNY